MQLISILLLMAVEANAQQPLHIITPLPLDKVTVSDSFWTPKLRVWRTKTVYDVFDKMEGNYEPDVKHLVEEKQRKGRTRNAYLNFDRVAKGEKDTKNFDGLPWFDGLIYETIRGAADLLVEYPDAALERRIDGYIDRIAAAQAADKTGYINTYTTLDRSHQRWGSNGGDDKWQHDIYNSGMLIEAAVHYYKATGKTKLLDIAVKQSNCICDEIGPAPKVNAIPGHAGPEEALLKLFQLFRAEPALKQEINAPVDENRYYEMVQFWITNRGHYGGKDGMSLRRSDSSYNQDHVPVLEQKTIEGHAVRATLLATGVAAMALENKEPAYLRTLNYYWDNMIGKRMFITGGQGAVADGERFGADYFLPESAYLETCAAIGAGFFSEKMNELWADGKYIDELERVLYNNMLSGISLSGDHYFYQNPLKAIDHKRWSWHDCPCCPPMFLKMVGVLPSYIYTEDSSTVYVNLFVGSEASTAFANIKQQTEYPWKGSSVITVDPIKSGTFTVKLRIPGWAQGKENPFDLYKSKTTSTTSLKLNGKPMALTIQNGYATITRTWRKGDQIELNLPVQPRFVYPNGKVAELKGKVAIAAGPVIYAMEGPNVPVAVQPFQMNYNPLLLGGVNVIKGAGFEAIPFYAIGNRAGLTPYTVWLKAAN